MEHPIPTFISCVAEEKPWEDIPNDAHREFIVRYLQSHLNPLQAHCAVNQKLNVECDGEMEACEVRRVDASLMEIEFRVSGYLQLTGEPCLNVSTWCVNAGLFLAS